MNFNKYKNPMNLLQMLREFRMLLVCLIGVTGTCIVVMYWGAFKTTLVDLYRPVSSHVSNTMVIAHGAASLNTIISASHDDSIRPSYSLSNSLQQNLGKKSLAFNMLPPGHWIIVDNLGIKAPIVDVAYADTTKLEKGDFHSELENGVVRYPYTATPGQVGNTVLFGHSSVEIWNHSKFGYVFQKLAKLPLGEKIKVVRDGSLYDYDVDHKEIKWPKDVPGTINEWQQGEYLTLMACYPLFSDAQRVLVRARRLVKNDSTKIASIQPNNYLN